MKKMYNSLKLLAVILLGLGWSASAQSPVTFNYTGGVQTYTVPICVTQLTVNVKGASGGYNSDPVGHLDSPGHGGCVTATLAVTPGQVLTITVGGQGANGTTAGLGAAGGYPNGGRGANNAGGGTGPYGGGGGGGKSDISIGATQVIVAGGGGGAGLYCGLNKEFGGDGGGLTGATGGALCVVGTTTGGGGGSIAGAPGLGGTCTGSCTGFPGSPGVGPTVGTGGAAGGCCVLGAGSAGGGGGGGYYGGGGGQWTGGGGGSNYSNATYASSVAHTRGCNVGAGTVIITPVCATPAITGTTTVCMGFNSTLANGCAGGIWSSSNTATATIDASGFVTSVAAGTTTISYTAGPCVVTTVFTVNPLPTAILGTTTVCQGLTTTLSDTSGTGTWSSSTTSVATVGLSTGVVTGVTAGTTTITFTLPTGCITTTVVTVNPLPPPNTGATQVCAGLTITLANALPGTWSSSDGAIATIDAGGVVTGLTAGTAIITFTIPTGCITTTTVTVNPLPGAIGGTPVVCEGSTTTLSNSGGGTWISSNTSVATIGTSSGIVSGIVAGTTVITYTLPTSCLITTTVLVNPLPASITGTASVCLGLTTTLSDATGTGTWSSGSTAVASVDPASGVVTGLSVGTAVISYTLSTGCYKTITATVQPLPAAIVGTGIVCQGLTTSLTDPTSGGTWISGNTAVATISSGGGIVGGVTAGTASITYTITATGCIATTTVLVNPLTAIMGFSTVCVGLTSPLTDTTSGGIWVSSTGSVATVDVVSGVVTGVGFGTTIITYQLPTGCAAYLTVSVNPLSPITGPANVCVGSCINFTDAAPGGVWSSSSSAIAVIGSSSGILCGVSAGTVDITYTLGTGCQAYSTVTVNPLPAAISGTFTVCAGQCTTLTDATGTGTWSSSDPAVAIISGTGDLCGVSAGTTIISYILPTGCYTTITATVDPLAAVSGPASVCVGLCINYTDAVSGGTWSSSNAAVATIDATGLACGVTAGTATITYTTATGCVAVKTLIVNPLPAPFGGFTEVCVGQSTTLTETSGGGTWSSSTTSVATVTSTGDVWGAMAGTTTISYVLPTGCLRTATVVVDSLLPISGPAVVCQGTTISFTDAVAFGTWSSSASGVATVDPATGAVTGLSGGTAIITYSIASTGCEAYKTVTVHPVPAIPTGPASICVGTTGTFTDITGSGTWSSSPITVATIVSGSGVTRGVSAGTATITYTISATGCYSTTTVVIFTLAPITGTLRLCPGFCTTLADTAGGGTGAWSSTATGTATIDPSTGFACGVTAGTSIISYTLPTGCSATATFTVSPLPAGMTGPTVVCEGANVTWNDVTAGGTWTSDNTGIATVTPGPSTTATVHGVSAGTVTITFTVTATGCYSTRILTVNPIPAPIVGPFSVCQGLTTTISDVTTGGTWSSSTTTVATVVTGSGTTTTVTGVGGGTTTITYTTTATGCYVTAVFTVYPTPAITGITNVCEGLTRTLSETIGGGTWSSSDGAIASIVSATATTGTLSGVSAGTATITYTFTTGCISTLVVTVNPTPTAITGTNVFCQNATVTLTDTDPGGPGTWTSSNTGVATVTAGPATTTTVSGAGGGTATITYTLPTGCITTYSVTVNPIAPITGPTAVCMGSTITLSDATAGGGWSSSNTGVATVTTGGSSTTVTPVSVGTTVITYLMPSGCYAVSTITVNPVPAAITGATSVCAGRTITLSNTGSGNWTSSNTAVATATFGPSTTSTIGGVAAGSATITFTLSTGCYATYNVTVLLAPAAITGTTAVCIGQTTTFSDITGGGTWSSSNMGVATVGGTGIVTGVASGTSMITYMLSSGCFSTRAVTVNVLPTGITGATSVCIGSTIVLTDAATPAGTWTSSNIGVATATFGSSTTSTIGGVSSGTAIITYTLATGCVATYSITVLALPPVVVTASGPTTFCAGGFVVLNAPTGAGLTYQWFGLSVGAISGATSSSLIVTAGDTYTVRVSASSTGCSATSANIIVTVSRPTAAISIPVGTDTACASPGVGLVGSPAGMIYQWELAGVGIPGATNIAYTASITGTYTLRVTNPTGCSATHDTDVHIIASPGTSTTLGGPLNFCAGDSVKITGESGVGYTYQWHNLAGPIPGATNQDYFAKLADNYWVVVTNSTGCSTPSGVRVVFTTAAPNATVTAGGVTTFCAGGTVVLSGPTVPPPPAGTLYQWYSNGVPIPGATLINFTASSTANYTLKVTNPVSGCSALSPATTVAAVTTPVIAPMTATTFCWGGSATLSVVIVGGAGPVTYQWYRNTAIIPGAVNRTYSATTPGTYVCVVVVPGSCTITSTPAIVTENPLPNPLVTFDGIYFHTQTYYTTYQWYLNNLPISLATASATRAISNGNYKVAVTDTNGCQSFSDIFVLQNWSGLINEGVNPIVNGSNIRIYPNPAQHTVHIEAPAKVKAIISSIDGKVVIEQADATEINIDNLANGIYMIRIYDEAGQMVKADKLIKSAN